MLGLVTPGLVTLITLGLVTPASSAPPPTATAAEHHFISRPDLTPPVITMESEANGTEPGKIFLTPAVSAATEPESYGIPSARSGPLIVDNQGQPVWFAPKANTRTTALQVQRYQGEPVLTWWEGETFLPPGAGDGSYVIMNSAYEEVARVRPGNGMLGDLHDFRITKDNTALFTIFRPVTRDLSAIGGPKAASVIDGIVQEVDIATGEVIFEWHSLDHVGVGESYTPMPENPLRAHDYFHINSVEVDNQGDLLISGRHTSAVYKVDRPTGEIVWRLGGKENDFTMGRGAAFYEQHDARQQPDGTISIFDNRSPETGNNSRAIVLSVDAAAKTAKLVHSYPNPETVISHSQGNAQVLPGGNVFVGWGNQPYYTEFDSNGTVVMHANLGVGVHSYRAVRFPWVGRPTQPPAVVPVVDGSTVRVYTSWNGGTDIANWQLLAGADPETLRPVAEAGKTGFETELVTENVPKYVQVKAMDSKGTVLATSEVTPVPS